MNVSIEGIDVTKFIGMFSSEALVIAMSLALYETPSSCLYDTSCSSSTTIIPKFLKGKKRDDLAPIAILILPSVIPFQIIDLFFLEVSECQIAGSEPKNSLNLLLN